MKRYALFAGETYYSRGGWFDFANAFSEKSAAIRAAMAAYKDSMKDEDAVERIDWWHVIDTQRCKLVCNFYRVHGWNYSRRMAKRRAGRRIVWKPKAA